MPSLSELPRVAFWTPLPPCPSRLVNYSLALLKALSEYWEIEVFSTDDVSSASTLTTLKIQPASVYPQRHSDRSFDLNLYQMANEPEHCAAIYEQILRTPGLLVLHDSSLDEFYRGYWLDHDRVNAYLYEVEYNYGLDTRTQIQNQLDQQLSLDTSDLDLLRRVVESSFGVIVHDTLLRDQLQTRYPHKPVIHIDLGETTTDSTKIQWGSIAKYYIEAGHIVLQGVQNYVPSQKPHPTGVNFIGDLSLAAGLGEAASKLFEATRRQGIPVSYTELKYQFTRTIGPTHSGLEVLPRGINYPINILAYNQHELIGLPPEQVRQILRNRYTIAYWFWEMPKIPKRFEPAFDLVDEIWTASRYVQASMQTVAKGPVQVVPVPVEVPTSPKINRADFGLPENRFIFFFGFNVASCLTRKNPWGVIDAFEKAFGRPGHTGPLLVIKAHYLKMLSELRPELMAAIERVGGILLEENLSRQKANDLLACMDAYVSLHRAEGFGLGIAESMYLGKPVIATNYSGNADFINPKNSYPVNYQLRAINTEDFRLQPSCQIFYEPGQLWAEPDIKQAAEWMDRIYTHPDEARERGRQAALDIRQHCSLAVVGQIVEERLLQIEAGIKLWRTPRLPEGSDLSGATEAVSHSAGIHLTALSRSHQEAIDDWFQVYEWAYNLPFAKSPLATKFVQLSPIAWLWRTTQHIRRLAHLTSKQKWLNSVVHELMKTMLNWAELLNALAESDRTARAQLQNQLSHLQEQVDHLREQFSNEQINQINHLRERLSNNEKNWRAAQNRWATQLSDLRAEVRLNAALPRAHIRPNQLPESNPAFILTDDQFVSLLKQLDHIAPYLAQSRPVGISIQSSTTESLILLAAAYFGERLQIHELQAWYHLDFTSDWNRPSLFENAMANLVNSGWLVLITESQNTGVADVNTQLHLCYDQLIGVGSLIVRVYIWQFKSRQ